MMRNVIVFICLFFIYNDGFSIDYYVSKEGKDTSPGTLQKPFLTIQKAVNLLKPGDSCFIREGRYLEKINFQKLNGLKNKKILITSYQNEKVVLDGTELVKGKWEKYKDQIYKIQLDKDIWQVFINEQSMTLARWPNGNFDDKKIWDLKQGWRHISPKSSYGYTIDERPHLSHQVKRDKKKKRYLVYTPLPDGMNTESLADTGLDMTGAIVILNIGSWLSWAQYVKSHKSGSAEFTYSTNFSASGEGMNNENKLNLLDQPDEWYFDRKKKILYIKTPDGRSPENHQIKVKTKTYLLSAKESSYIHIQGLHFFGTTLNYEQCQNMIVENCNFLYPSYSKRALGELKRPEVTSLKSSDDKSTGNIIRNCRFEYMDGPGIDIAGKDDLIENCYFQAIDFSCLGGGGEGALNLIKAMNLTFRKNTVHTAGNSEGVRVGKGNLIELNHVYNMSLLQHDGSTINVGMNSIKNSVIKKNWSHDTHKPAIRFDSTSVGTDNVKYGTHGSIIGNVVWNSVTVKIKGNQHKVYNNTAFDMERVDISILDRANFGGINTETETINNAAFEMSGDFKDVKKPLPGIVKNNWIGKLKEALRDPDNWDFRPKEKSPLVDKGSVIKGYNDHFEGSHPDIGAYEYGRKNYWIPGYQSKEASTPIPPDKSKTVKVTADIMWLPGYRMKYSHVYFGTDEKAVFSATRKSKEYRSSQKNNIYTPGNLKKGVTYYWRIDTALIDKTIIKGKVWSFQCQ
jgi:hypothetical protein